MRKAVFRYFFDFFKGQEKWLNSMAERGYRLKKCGKMTYTFDECEPAEYEYAVEYIGDKSYSKAKDYRGYLESMGFRTFTKNINLNFSYGKVRWRPYAKGMGQIATSPRGFNNELLILEKKRDGKPFELHTDLQDLLSSYRAIRNSYLWAVLCIFGLLIASFVPRVSVSASLLWIYGIRIALGIIGIIFSIPAVKYSLITGWLKEERKTNE